jgi:hypothetical protein
MKDPVADVVALEALWSAEYALVIACFMKSGRTHEERDIKIRSIHVGDEVARQRSFWRDRWTRATKKERAERPALFRLPPPAADCAGGAALGHARSPLKPDPTGHRPPEVRGANRRARR